MNNSAQKLLIILILVTLLTVASWIYLFLQVKKTNNSFVELSKELAKENTKESYLRSINLVLESSNDNREKLNQYFITGAPEIEFLERIESYADTTGAEIDIRAFERTGNELILTFEARGRFDQVYHTARLIDTEPLRLTVDRVLINRTQRRIAPSKAGAESGASVWEGRFEIRLAGLKTEEKNI